MVNERLIIRLRLSKREPKIMYKILYKHVPVFMKRSLLSSTQGKGTCWMEKMKDDSMSSTPGTP